LRLFVAGLDLGALGVEDLQIGAGGPQGLVARQEEVAGEAVLDSDDVADGAEARRVRAELSWSSLLHDIGQQRQEAGALDGLGQLTLLLLAETAVMREGTILPRSEM
jgi:hypothetical protein